MKYVDEFRNPRLVRAIACRLENAALNPVAIMEVCGTHTMSIFRHGLRELIPRQISLVSGPGCPVCVTPAGLIDACAEIAAVPGVIIASFGDMIRVPGAGTSLENARAAGADVRMVLSAVSALDIARQNPDRQVVFISVGFETTTPGTAAAVMQAHAENISNFSIVPCNRTMPAPLRLLMEEPGSAIQGLLCPGHVSVITGSSAFEFLPSEYGIACAIAGFEPADIMQGILSIVEQVENGNPHVENCYGRAVNPGGNPRARALAEEVFRPCDAWWRGLGLIKESGLALRRRYRSFDALQRFGIEPAPGNEPPGCLCGKILRGAATPVECPLFEKKCVPSSPVGPCMVSAEGTCAAWYRYGIGHNRIHQTDD